MASSFKVDLSQLLKALSSIGTEIEQTRAAEEDLLAAAQPIVDAAKSNAPRDPGGRPGFAADTIHAEPFPTRQEGEIARVGVGPDETGWHLKFSEFGTSKEAARPWLRPAVDTESEAFGATLYERLRIRIQRAWRG